MRQMFYIDSREALEILISVIAISFALSMVFFEPSGFMRSTREFIMFMGLAVVTIGSGFVLHEMGHKLVAIYYGAQARFVMWTQGLLLMLVTSVFGVMFAAPGAVYIYAPNIGKQENGTISLAGPAVNVVIMAVFLALFIFTPVRMYFSALAGLPTFFGISNGMVNVWLFGASINLMLAIFNMIPVFPLDGSKVLAWSTPIYLATLFLMMGIGVRLLGLGAILMWGVLLVIAFVFSKLIFR